MLFLAYPRSDYDEPDGALASYVEVLSGYSDAIVQHVTSNKTGIQRRQKYPPRVAELVAACDESAAAIERVNRYQNWGRSNEPALLEGPQVEKPTLEELKAKYGPNWGLGTDKPIDVRPQAPTKEQLAHHYQHYGLGFKPKQSDDAA